MKTIIESIESKVKRLVLLYKQIKQENSQLENENKSLQLELAKKEQQIVELEEKIKVIKITHLVSSSDEDKKRVKIKINEYVREIDRCIALLNQ